MDVMNVEKFFGKKVILLFINDVILERNFMDVFYVVKFLIRSYSLLDIRDVI